jgi:DNA-binding transcriptional regulator YiaG
MGKKFKSKILESIYEDAQALFEIGAISEEEMQEYAHECLIDKQVASGDMPQKTPERRIIPAYASTK